MTNLGATFIPRIGKRLFALALQAPPHITQRDIEELIKGCKSRKQVIDGSRSIKAARVAFSDLVESLACVRESRLRCKHNRNDARGYVLPGGRLRERADDMICQVLSDQVSDSLRYGDELSVVIGAEFSVSQSITTDWDYYAKSCKYPKKMMVTTIVISRSYWRTRGADEEHVVIDDRDPSRVLYIRQGRGNELRAGVGRYTKGGALKAR